MQLHQMEKKYYTEEHIAPYEEVYKWNQKFPWSSAVLEEDGKIVAFLDMFPIKEHLLQKIQSGTYNDSNLTYEDIVDITTVKQGHFHMFLCCMVIEKEYRNKDTQKLLFNQLIDFYATNKTDQVIIDRIITDNVTEEGIHLSKKLGFKKAIDSDYQSTIYLGKYDSFVKTVKSL